MASPWANPMPSTVPIAEATTPSTTASATTMRITWRRLEPIARSVAVSLVRCATVIEKALKITNPPTIRATIAKSSRNVLRNEMPWCAVSLACLIAVWPVTTSTSGYCPDAASVARTRAASSDCETPGRSNRPDAVDATRLAEHSRRGRRRERHDARAAGIVVGPVGRDAAHGVLGRAGRREHAHRVAGCEAAIPGGGTVDHDLVVRGRRTALDEPERVEARRSTARPCRSASPGSCCRRAACRRDRRGAALPSTTPSAAGDAVDRRTASTTEAGEGPAGRCPPMPLSMVRARLDDGVGRRELSSPRCRRTPC